MLGLEDTGSRMSRIGKAELLAGDLWSTAEVLAAIDAVTVDDVREVASGAARGDADAGGHRPVRRRSRLLVRCRLLSGSVGPWPHASVSSVRWAASARRSCAAVEAADDLELVADRRQGRQPRALVEAGCEVVVDFTHPDVVLGNVEFLRAARHPRRGRHHRLGRRALRPGAHAGSRQSPGDRRARRPELRHRRGAHDAVRRAGRAVLRVGRDRRAAPPAQGRRARPAPRPRTARADRRGSRTRPASARCRTPPRSASTAPAAATSTASRCTRCACAAWSSHQEVLLRRATGETFTIRHDSTRRRVVRAGRAARRPPGRRAPRPHRRSRRVPRAGLTRRA